MLIYNFKRNDMKQSIRTQKYMYYKRVVSVFGHDTNELSYIPYI